MTWRPDPDFDLEHGLLRNRLGITDPKELAAAEAELTAQRLIEIEQEPITGSYDLDHLLDLHEHIMGDLYFFAGQVRTVSMAKNADVFCDPEQVLARAEEIFDQRSKPEYLRTRTRREILDDLASLMADMTWLHPAREGNGRVIRALLGQLASDSGWRITWVGLDRDRSREAAQAGHLGDLGPLRELLDERLIRIGPPLGPPPPRTPE